MASLYSDGWVTVSAPSSIYTFQLKSPRDSALRPFLPARRQDDPSDLRAGSTASTFLPPPQRQGPTKPISKGRETGWRTPVRRTGEKTYIRSDVDICARRAAIHDRMYVGNLNPTN